MGEFEEFFGNVDSEAEVNEDANLNTDFAASDSSELDSGFQTDDSFNSFAGEDAPTLAPAEEESFDLDSALDGTETLPITEPESSLAQEEHDTPFEPETIPEPETISEPETLPETHFESETTTPEEPISDTEEDETQAEDTLATTETTENSWAENNFTNHSAPLPTTDTTCQKEANFVQWYSGSVHDQMFEITKNNIPDEINGDATNKIIHINIGLDSYGWLIEFDNSLTMSLEDVRKYQLKNGALPSSSGILRYGQNTCSFSNIERILIYKSVRYFSYSNT